MMDYTLEEDIPDEFKGGTLELNIDENKPVNESSGNQEKNDKNCEESETPNSWKNSFILPFAQKLTDTLKLKKSDKPLNCETSIQVISAFNETATNFFTFREGIVDKAVDHCTTELLRENDGHVIAKFLLTEINLWDSDKERLILLTENTCFAIKYDFIALKLVEYRRISLLDLDCVVIGDLVYPPGSLVPHLNGMADGFTNIMHSCLLQGWSKSEGKMFESMQIRERNMKGVRLMWNKGKPLGFSEKWNPFNDDVPLCTLTNHPLYNNEECGDDQKWLYSLDDFIEKLKEMIHNVEKTASNNCTILHKSIVLQNYIGLSSLIHNRNALGYFKVRGKFSF